MSMVEEAEVMDPTMGGADRAAPEAEGRRREEARGLGEGDNTEELAG